jgi:hypothetical protein
LKLIEAGDSISAAETVAANYYYVSAAIQDNDKTSYDLDNALRIIVDPIAIGSKATSYSSRRDNGCDIGISGAFAILALGAMLVIRKRI